MLQTFIELFCLTWICCTSAKKEKIYYQKSNHSSIKFGHFPIFPSNLICNSRLDICFTSENNPKPLNPILHSFKYPPSLSFFLINERGWLIKLAHGMGSHLKVITVLTWVKLLILSQLQFPHLYSGDNYIYYIKC